MYDEVSKKLKEWKKQSKMTISEISKKSGIPEPTLTKLFAGQTKNPTLQTVAKLTHLFGYTLDDLENEVYPEQKENSPVPEQTETRELSLEETDKLLVALGFIKEGEQLSDDDLAFLEGIVRLLDAWFKCK